MRTPARALKVLDARTYSILAAIADRVAPGGRGLPKASDLGVAEAVDDLMSTVHPGDGAELRQVLLFIENAVTGLLFDGAASPFTARSAEEQDATLQAMRTSLVPLRRTMWKAVVGLVNGAYWAQEPTWTASRYPGPPDYGNGRGLGPSRPPIVRTAAEGGPPPGGPGTTAPSESASPAAPGEGVTP
jgi:hypothetical protein